MNPKIKPLGGCVLVEVIDEQTKVGDFVLAEEEKKPTEKRSIKAKVLQCGSKDIITDKGMVEVPCPVKEGDIIIYEKWQDHDVSQELNNTKYKIVKFQHILGIVEE